jgi:hypothetical protein
MLRQCVVARSVNQAESPKRYLRRLVVICKATVMTGGTMAVRVSTTRQEIAMEWWKSSRCTSLTGTVEARQSLQRNIVEHKYAARWQHSEMI